MNKETIKDIVRYLNDVSYRDLFGAICVFERCDYLHDLEDLNDGDIEYLEELFEYFMNNDYFTGIFNVNEITEMFEEHKRLEEE